MTPTEHIYSLAEELDTEIEWYHYRDIPKYGRSCWGGSAYAPGHIASRACVAIPRPWKGVGAYLTGLHELGHVSLGHCTNGYRFYRRYVISAEIAAFEFTFENSILPVSDYMIRQEHQALKGYKESYPYAVTRYALKREKEVFGTII